jgi:hypothetical protein
MKNENFILVTVSENVNGNYLAWSNQVTFSTEKDMIEFIQNNVIGGSNTVMFKGSVKEWDNILLKELNKPLIVTGHTRGTDDNRIIEWEDPDTGEIISCKGQFDYDSDLDKFTHDVVDDNRNIIYTVHA